MFGPYAGTEVHPASWFGVHHPNYTAEERALLEQAKEILERAWEGGHFSDLPGGGDGKTTLATLHLAADRAMSLLPEGVTVVARSTAVGDRILVGIAGRT
jgi:hypothetical protein